MMDRRKFLAALGLGGVAATKLDKPEVAVATPSLPVCPLCKLSGHQPTYGMLRYRSVHSIDSGGYYGGSYEMPDAALTCWCPNAPVDWRYNELVGGKWWT